MAPDPPTDPAAAAGASAADADAGQDCQARTDGTSTTAASPAAAVVPATGGHFLTGKQEHYLKRELISEQVKWEIAELNTPTALRRFGAPFRSDVGEVSPLDSDLPILRYIFVHHVRDFPFLDRAKEKEFWQDKLQVFLESFASKEISSSEDRLEETKRRKLAIKCQKLVELMVVSGIKTSSGFEERIRFSEIELVDSNAIDTGVMHTLPEGNYINGWDVNVAAARVTATRRYIRQHKHAMFLLRVKRKGEDEFYVDRRYGDFSRLVRDLRLELPGKELPSLPKKNKSDSTAAAGTIGSYTTNDDASSVSSVSTQHTAISQVAGNGTGNGTGTGTGIGDGTRSPRLLPDHHRVNSAPSSRPSPRLPGSPALSTLQPDRLTPSMAQGRFEKDEPVVLWRESQRISLRAFLRTLLHNPQVAQTKAMREFLTRDPQTPTDADMEDIVRRKAVDAKRVEEQKQFYEVARKRAAELDVYMEQFRRDIVEKNGLTMLFQEIREKDSIEGLSIQYRKFAEWLRIEVAATIYHMFLAEDNSPELFAQAKRIHSLIPYTVIKNVIRIANPAAVMSGILDIFLSQPFGVRSLMQRIFSLTLHDGISTLQRAIESVRANIADPALADKLLHYTEAAEETKLAVREEAAAEQLDQVVAILKTDLISAPLTEPQYERVFNAYVAFNHAVENDDPGLREGAQDFSHLKQLLKLYTRQRDKAMMLRLIEEPVTLKLFRDLFTIFYEPLVRVYKSANVYGSVTDLAAFIDDVIQVVERCRDEDASADPNQTVQAFIDLCARHEHHFYKFVHEVHTHDDGLFTRLMGWVEAILAFLRNGPKRGTLDINALFEGAVTADAIDRERATAEIDRLIGWQEARKKWHHDKTRQKMAAEGGGLLPSDEEAAAAAAAAATIPGAAAFSSADFGINQNDLDDMALAGESESEEEDELEFEEEIDDPVEAERWRRAKLQDRLRRTAGEPAKPEVSEVHKLKEGFLVMLRQVLAE